MSFAFATPDSLKNELSKPQKTDGVFPSDGALPTNQELLFDAGVIRNFSAVTVTATLAKNSVRPSKGTLTVKKSYRAYFYPEGEPAPIRSSFTETGDSLFIIDNIYYQLINGTLRPFVSEQAFHSQYPNTAATPKPASFLRQYPLADEPLGFADGTLLATTQFVGVVSNGILYPFNTPATVEALGYDWNTVIQASSEEAGIYPKGKLIDINRPHPDGTILLEKETGKTYLVENNTKRPILDAAVLASYGKPKPIEVDAETLSLTAICNPTPVFLSPRHYRCTIPIEQFQQFRGNDFQFNLTFPESVRLEALSASFQQPIKWTNLRATAKTIRDSIRLNYSR